ncbi:hypothetical protein [Streptomyces sp. NPDC050263]|uniref:hypothetical protein n=1 Tax=Streptomyces sp. NPDC050263 TaxID=3155037 RepID=UPI0034393804
MSAEFGQAGVFQVFAAEDRLIGARTAEVGAAVRGLAHGGEGSPVAGWAAIIAQPSSRTRGGSSRRASRCVPSLQPT